MNTSTNVVHLRQPEELEDPLTDVLRAGARRLLAQAVELEAEAFLAGMRDLKLPDGPARSARPWAGASGPDRDRPRAGRAREDPGSRRDGGRGAGPLHLGPSAEVGETDAKPRRTPAGSLSARGSPPATSRRHSRRSSAKTPRTSRHQSSRGLTVDHSTLNRWVLAYAPAIERRLRRFCKPHCRSVRVDETYIRVRGQW